MVQRLEHAKKIIVDQHTVDEVNAVLAVRATDPITSITVSFANGRSLELNSTSTALVEALLQSVGQGKFSVQTLPRLVSTTVAADLLGVTRPTLKKWVEAGKISARKVGSHLKLDSGEILRVREEQWAGRKAAFDALRQFEQDNGLSP